MPDANSLFNEAVNHHKAGRFADAEKFYRQLIKIAPMHVHAVRLLGGLYFQTEQMNEALEFLGKATKLMPNNAEILTNLGSTLRKLGKTDEAIDRYNQAIAAGPNYIPAFRNLANILYCAGKTDEALKLYGKVLELSPQDAEAYFNVAEALEKLGQGEQAIAYYDQAVKFKPDYLDAMIKLGIMLGLTGNKERSTECLQAAQNLLEQKHQADPQNVDTLNTLANLLTQRGNPLDALSYLRKALDISPHHFTSILHSASCHRDLHQLDEALHFAQMAVQIKPDSADARIMLGLIYHDLMRHEEAIEQYARALEHNAPILDVHMKQAMSLLALGKLEEGFQRYETGLVNLPYMRGNLFAHRRWQKESLVGKRLLIWCEQGLGDSLQFIRYAQLCKERGVHIIVLCPASLRPLFRNCPYIDELPETVTEKDFDFHVATMSLPYVFNTTLETIPDSVPYLYVSDSKRAQWASKFPHTANLKVGLVWSGNPRGRELKWGPLNRRRNIDLEKLLPLFDITGIDFYSLQMDAAAAQIDTNNLRDRIIDLTKDVHDFEDTAAIIQNLDLVISVDTSVVHLTGALGKPVWVMSRFDACWRWLQNRPTNPWYPTARVYGQKISTQWDDVITAIKSDLKTCALSNKVQNTIP